jgi:LPXTG-motif cell wall-anchored protein
MNVFPLVVASLFAAPATGGDNGNTAVVVAVAALVVAGFVFFGLRAVRIMRDRPLGASEFLRRWFGK